MPLRALKVALPAPLLLAALAAADGLVAHASGVATGAASLASTTYSVVPSSRSVVVAAQRVGGSQGRLSVSYTTVEDSALAGTHFVPVSGILTWADGDAADKSIVIPIAAGEFDSGAKSFAVQLGSLDGAGVGVRDRASVSIVTGAPSGVFKSVREFVSCNEEVDESTQLQQALLSAAHDAFTLVIDCPVRFHTGAAAQLSIAVPEGVTLSFQGAGEFLVLSNGVPALTIDDPSGKPTDANFLDWRMTDL
jgi:hypothetical protein